MNFSIRIKGSAAKELRRVGKQDRARIVAAIDGLADNPFQGTALKEDLGDLRLPRVGEYRAKYGVQQDVLVAMVVRAARRRAAYGHRPR